MISAIDAADDGIFERVTDDVAALVSSISPNVVILSKTDFGSVVGARLAFRIDAVFAADCIEISNSGDSVSVTRPVFGGSALAEYEIASSPAIVTLRAGAYEPTGDSGTPEVESFNSGVTTEQRASGSDTILESREDIRLEDVDFIVSGGEVSGDQSLSAFLAISQTCRAVPLEPPGRRATLDG